MKKLLFTLFSAYLFVQCNTAIKTKSTQETVVSPLADTVVIAEPTLKDSIQQIRDWFGTINRNAEAGNYERLHHEIKTDSLNLIITEFRDKGTKSRKKIVYKSDEPGYDLPLRNPSVRVNGINREYYYWDDRLFFIYEIVETKRDSINETLENRFYFASNRMIRWIEGKATIERTDTLFKKLDDAFASQKVHLLQPYDYFMVYNGTKTLFSDSKRELMGAIYKHLHFTFPKAESIQTVFINLFKNTYVLEVITEQKSVKETSLFVFETSLSGQAWEAKGELFARLPKSEAEIQTPAEFIYYMIQLAEKNDTLKLRELIPKQGYETHVTVSIGDVDTPQYDKLTTVSKDTLRFEHLGFPFGLSIFEYNPRVNKFFHEDGKASITISGGGFSESVYIRKIKNKVYLQRHTSLDH
ncbi:hypothetical protein QWY31_09525 [Cytophagales bacterium LB-30]|uniref:Lipoprotein n=1 Tax=Shiella aurantiaca TaxID=3058365 RepID=A0ABT8F5J6_9BACT|nr:hypothetical protein [Shiella aurantiaca]MDN4165742.1 hypothetical protein [Shiella aurantiaca]